jgi:hypothetical protein
MLKCRGDIEWSINLSGSYRGYLIINALKCERG